MIRVLLADDHQLFRQGLRRLLESERDMEVLGEANNGLDVQRMVEELHPDVVLMDVSMAIIDGISATREIVRQWPDVKVVILSMHAAGGALIAPSLTGKVLTEFRRMASKMGVEDGLGQLSDVEMRLLQLIASGLSNKEIASRLCFAESTVKNRLSVLFQKIDVTDRTQAAIYAITHGLAPAVSASELAVAEADRVGS